MKFIYRAKNKANEIDEGEIEAPNKDEALNILWKKGLFPLDIESADVLQPGAVAKKEERKFLGIFTQRITSHHILIFTQNLATLVRARLELLTALRIVHEQTDHPVLGGIIFDIYTATREGRAFSASLARYPKVFSPLYVNIIKAGEAGGALDSALDQITEFFKREESLKSKVTAALAYPSMLLLVGAGSIFVLINFVIPRLMSMFEGLGQDLPLITRIVLNISTLSNKSWWIICLVLLLGFLVIYSQKGAGFFKEIIRRCRMKIPVISRITKDQELVYFSRSLGLLLKSGVPVLKSLSTVIPGISNPGFRKELEDALKKLSAGASFFSSVQGASNLPRFFVRMIAVGEQSGRLSDIFEELSNSYTQEIEADINILSALLEPILILFMGLIMGTIVISILIPMFEITQMVG